MSISVVCPNGHALRVKNGCAGKSGLCPVCRARIEVPCPANGGLSEDDVLDILGPHDPGRTREFSAGEPDRPPDASGLSQVGRNSPPKKSCEKCNAEISAATHICPHCHTYIGQWGDLPRPHGSN